jgi:hypothetical protein
VGSLVGPLSVHWLPSVYFSPIAGPPGCPLASGSYWSGLLAVYWLGLRPVLLVGPLVGLLVVYCRPCRSTGRSTVWRRCRGFGRENLPVYQGLTSVGLLGAVYWSGLLGRVYWFRFTGLSTVGFTVGLLVGLKWWVWPVGLPSGAQHSVHCRVHCRSTRVYSFGRFTVGPLVTHCRSILGRSTGLPTGRSTGRFTGRFTVGSLVGLLVGSLSVHWSVSLVGSHCRSTSRSHCGSYLGSH